MKKTKVIALCIALALTLGVFTACRAAQAQGGRDGVARGFDARQFPRWFYEEGVWRTLEIANALTGHPGGFVTEASGRPSMEDIELILNTASLAVTSGGRTDWYMILVTDTESQHEIIGIREGIPIATSEGTVTVLIFSERLIRTDLRTDQVIGFAPDRGYYNVGILTGYLNMIAVSMGFGTRMFMTPGIPGNGFRNGERWLEAEHFLEGRYYIMGATGDRFSAENMKLVNAIVIGTPNRTVETFTTQRLFPQNWSHWEPGQTAAVGGAPAGAAGPVITLADIDPIANLTNGVFTGRAYGFFHVPLVVEVTVAGGVITGIEVLEHRETELYFVMATQGSGGAVGVIPQMLETQNVSGINAVAGATATSTAVVRAVADALTR